MRIVTLILAAVIAAPLPSLAQVGATVPLPAAKTLLQLPGRDVVQVLAALNGRRLYYVTAPDTLWLYDVASRRSTKLGNGEFAELVVSARGDLLAFLRESDRDSLLYVWTMPLDANTGRPAGAPRRASTVVSYSTPVAISPDSKSLAYAADSNGKRLVVIPASGGSERELLRSVGSVQAPQWSLDGRWIYYTVSLGSEDDFIKRVLLGGWTSDIAAGPQAEVFRIPASGGTAERLARSLVFGDNHGLSPDGKLLTFTPIPGSPLSILQADSAGLPTAILDANGKMLVSIMDAPTMWFSPTQLLESRVDQRNSVRAMSLSNGRVREIFSAEQNVEEPAWAPDGKTFVASGRWSADTVTLHIANADASGRRSIKVFTRSPTLGNVTWSPDSRWIAMSTMTGIIAVEASTGRAQALALSAPRDPTTTMLNASLRWSADSRRIRYVTGTQISAGGLLVVRETGFDGRDVLVREIARGQNPLDSLARNIFNVSFLTDTSVYYTTDSNTYVHSLATGRALAVSDARSAGTPAASPDGSMIAFRKPLGGGQGAKALSVVSSSGRDIGQVTFPAAIGRAVMRAPIFTNEGKSVVISARTAANGCCSIYISTLNGSLRKVGDIPLLMPVGQLYAPYLALSPDGSTLLFTAIADKVTTLSTYDISAILRNAPKQ